MQSFNTRASIRSTRGAAVVVAGLLICAAAQAVGAGPAGAVPIGRFYVDTSGVGSACSQLAPCATIDDALTAAASSPRALINVGPGTFSAASNPILSGTMSISGIPGLTIVGGASGNGFQNDGGSLTLAGLQITSFPVGVLTTGGATALVQDSVTGGMTAISATAGTTTVTGSTLSGTSDAVSLTGGSLLVDQSTISGAGGSGIAAGGGTTLTVRGSTIAMNANGIAADTATVTIASSTIAENTLDGIDGTDSQTTVFGSIFADNPGGDCSATAAAGLIDNGYNLDSDGTCALLSYQGSLSAVDPGLGGLADNGGLAQTESIGAASPARDLVPMASCPGVDQRGESRAAPGFCDSGAYEYAAPTALQFVSPPITGPTSAHANLGPVTVQQLDADGNPASSGGLVTLHLSSATPNSSFAQTPGGAATSAVTIPADAPSSSFFVGDTTPTTVDVTVTAAGLTSAAQSETVVTGPAASFTTDGDSQSAVTHHDFGVPLSALVVDGTGNLVTGAVVTFAWTGPGAASFPGDVLSVDVLTDSSGIATTPLAAGATAGTATVTISVPGVSASQDLHETVTAGPATAVQAASGAAQTVVPHQLLAPLHAAVSDADGNPVPGAVVTFAVSPAGAATFASGATTAVTDAFGVAVAPDLTAGALARHFTVGASTPGAGMSATFAETLTNGPAATTVATAGNAQRTPAHITFATRLAVRVSDADRNVVPGQSVTFTVSSAGSATFPGGTTSATVVTASNGIATAPVLTAGSHACVFTVTAAVMGSPSATFHETVFVGPRPIVTSVSPNNSPTAGGRVVAIHGTGFIGTTSVHFGTSVVTAAHFGMSSTATVIYVRAPAHTMGGVQVTVTASGGTSALVAADRFYYLNAH